MLDVLQRAFHDAVLGGDDKALAGLTAAPRGDIAARIAVYRNTVQGSLVGVLAAAFPVTQRIVGPAFFADLAQRFVVAAPPHAPQLSAYGADFPAFVAHEHDNHGLAYLADVARVEWARAESYFAADAPALDPAALSAIAPPALDGTVLMLHPATRLVCSAYAVYRIWQVNQPSIKDVPAVDLAWPQSVLLSRSDGRVALRLLSAGDAAFITAIQSGVALGAAAAQAYDTEPAFDLEAGLRDNLIGATFRA